MTPEKRAELLHYAADHPDAMFMSKKFTAKVGYKLASFEMMIKWHGYDDWEIYHAPKNEVSYDYVHIGRYETKEDVFSTIKGNSLCIPIKITKSSNGDVKVEIVE
jgi:hypothetical protein